MTSCCNYGAEYSGNWFSSSVPYGANQYIHLQVDMALKYLRGFVPVNDHQVQAALEKAARRFMAQVVEGQAGDFCVLDRYNDS